MNNFIEIHFSTSAVSGGDTILSEKPHTGTACFKLNCAGPTPRPTPASGRDTPSPTQTCVSQWEDCSFTMTCCGALKCSQVDQSGDSWKCLEDTCICPCACVEKFGDCKHGTCFDGLKCMQVDVDSYKCVEDTCPCDCPYWRRKQEDSFVASLNR
jgi:hypothetical protein